MQAHALHPVAKELRTPGDTAKTLGFRMPAEWEPIDCVYVTRPHCESTWPGCMDEAISQFETMVHAMRRYVDVESTQSLQIETNDSWIRDYGPIFVRNEVGELACHDFVFNCWGGKYADCELDDVVPQQIAAKLEAPIWIHSIVLEGGSIDVNGRGCVMTTEQCLLSGNRNPELGRRQIEQVLHDALGTSHIIWLPGGIEGDDTDGHIDDVARFIGHELVAAVRPGWDHPDKEVLDRNWQVLCNARSESGHQLNLLELPAPQPIHYEYPTDHFHLSGRQPLPASYANFLFANRALLVPTFGQSSDDVALRVLDDALPEHEIVPIRSEHLIVGRGGVHCLTMQRPC